jgi:ribosomal protein S12 methylthiotransferase
MIAQNQISYDNNQKLIGKEIEVLIDEVIGKEAIARTEFDAPEVDNTVILPAKKHKAGDLVKVKIKKAEDYDLFGI